jgi:TBC1 domain family protein 5
MRSLDSAREGWSQLKQYKHLPPLRTAVRLDGHSSAATTGLRSASWKAFLLFEDLDTPTWPRTLLSSRSAYNSLRMHFLRAIENPDEHADPLSNEATDVSLMLLSRWCV